MSGELAGDGNWLWGGVTIVLLAYVIFFSPTQINPVIPETDIIYGTVTNLRVENWWLQDHHIVSVDNLYVFETDLSTYMKLHLGDAVRLDREFKEGKWCVVKVTNITGVGVDG